MRQLVFQGIQKTTLIDYPGRVASTLFLGGCNFRCSYCYNPDLVLGRETGVRLPAAEALAFLRQRQRFLDGVCITGGEPLLHAPALFDFLQSVKRLGLHIKLDTNGSCPEPLREAIRLKLVDYLAMDIKAPLDQYAWVVQRPVDQQALRMSVELIRQADVDYEFRTTVFSGLTLEMFEAIGRWIAGSKRYALQPVTLGEPMLDEQFPQRYRAPTSADLVEIAARLRPYVEGVEIRAYFL